MISLNENDIGYVIATDFPSNTFVTGHQLLSSASSAPEESQASSFGAMDM